MQPCALVPFELPVRSQAGCYHSPDVSPWRSPVRGGKRPGTKGTAAFRLAAAMTLNSAEGPVNMGGDSLPIPPSRIGVPQPPITETQGKQRFHEFLRRAEYTKHFVYMQR